MSKFFTFFGVCIAMLACADSNQKTESADSPDTFKKPDFVIKVLRDQEAGNVPGKDIVLHNSDFLVKLPDTKESTVRQAAKALKDAYCQTYECNITLWDDEAAYNLSEEKKGLFSSKNSPYANMDFEKLNKLEQKWDKKHRNRISEHWLSWYPPVSNGDTAIAYFPLIDVTYKELGGKKLMGKDL